MREAKAHLYSPLPGPTSPHVQHFSAMDNYITTSNRIHLTDSLFPYNKRSIGSRTNIHGSLIATTKLKKEIFVGPTSIHDVVGRHK